MTKKSKLGLLSSTALSSLGNPTFMARFYTRVIHPDGSETGSQVTVGAFDVNAFSVSIEVKTPLAVQPAERILN